MLNRGAVVPAIRGNDTEARNEPPDGTRVAMPRSVNRDPVLLLMRLTTMRQLRLFVQPRGIPVTTTPVREAEMVGARFLFFTVNRGLRTA